MKTKNIIVRNAIKCKKCGDIIESKTGHDFKWCSCQACAVDGGHNYCRRLGNESDYEDMSIVKKLDSEAFIKQYEICFDCDTYEPKNCGRDEMKKLIEITGSSDYGDVETGKVNKSAVTNLYRYVVEKPLF